MIKRIRLFLASSSELENDRREFEIFISRKNKEYINKKIFLELVLWEDFLDAMSQTCLQDEYNRAVRECDIFVSLFYTKSGKYTQEEFEKAFKSFKEDGRPLIYTYFKNANIKTGEITEEIISLLKFKDKLKDLGHFYTNYNDINNLKNQFSSQLTKLEDSFLQYDQKDKEDGDSQRNNKSFISYEKIFNSVAEWNTEAPVANHISDVMTEVVEILNNVPGINPAHSRDFWRATPLFTLQDGSVLKTYKNPLGVDHVFIADNYNSMVFGGFVGWIHSKGLQEAIEIIKRDHVGEDWMHPN